MKKFHETYNLTDRKVLHGLTEFIGQTHEVIQQIEAGITGTLDQHAEATFMFLELIGYLPNTIEDGGKSVNVEAKGLISPGPGLYFVNYIMTGGGMATFPLFGPLSGPRAIMGDVKNLTSIIEHAFPKAVIRMTTGKSLSGETTYHTTVRPDFMRRSEARGYPVESGSAECSNASVSLMQATVRMIAAHVMGAMGAATAIDLHRAIRPKAKTLAEIAAEKYGLHNWDDLVKQITQPNKLLEGLKFDRSPEAKAARHAASYSMGTEKSGRQEIDELIATLKEMGIDVQVIAV